MFTNCCTLSTFCQDLVASAPNQRLFDDSVLFLGLFPILPVYLWLIALATGCPYSLDKCKTIIVVFKAPHFQCWNIGLLPLCNDTCMNLAAFVCLFPVWLWLRRSPCAWVDAVPAISGGLPPCSPNSCHLGNKPWELHWEVTQAWWWTSLSQKTLNASEGPHHVAVTISTVGRWRTSMVNKREQLSFSTVSPQGSSNRLLQQAVQGKDSPFLLCCSSPGNCLLLLCTILSRLQCMWGMEPLQIQVMCLLLICVLRASLKQIQIEFQTKDITTVATVVNDPFFENWHCHTHL